MVDKDLVSRKLSKLESYIDELRRARDIDWAKYQADLRSKAFVERYIHLAIEEVIDMANHIVSFNRWREPTSFRDLFSALSEHEIIPASHLATFQNMASFRNLLVHRYENVDDEMVFGIFKKRLGDFDLYIELISRWVRALDEESK